MSGINWSTFVMNNEPELKIFGSKNNTNTTSFINSTGSYRSEPRMFGHSTPTSSNRYESNTIHRRNEPATNFNSYESNTFRGRNEPTRNFNSYESNTIRGRNEPTTNFKNNGYFTKFSVEQKNYSTQKNNKDVIVEFPDNSTNIIKNPEEKLVEKPKETPKKITTALLKLDKVNNTINGFMEDFLSNSDISNNKEYLDLWKSSGNQDKLCLYIKQKKIKMKETIEERNAKKMEKKTKRETKLKDIHQKRMDKQQSKPKTAFYYFKEDETIKLKLEHPTWNRKEVHAELQKKWKEIKNTEEAKPYREKTKLNEE